jgi:hypothetical protein
VKILLDENLPHDLRHHLPGHEIFTTRYMGWSGVANGELLHLAAAQAFDAMLTLDNGVAYQQNIQSLPIAVVILSAVSNDLTDLLPLVPAILAALSTLTSKTIVRVP